MEKSKVYKVVSELLDSGIVLSVKYLNDYKGFSLTTETIDHRRKSDKFAAKGKKSRTRSSKDDK